MRSKFLTALLALAMVVSFTSTVQATNGMKLIGYGPIQRSMGGVSVALPLDAATVLTNPAGISSLKNRIDFGVSLFNPNIKYRAEGAGPGVVGSTAWFKSSKAISPIPAFGLVLPISDDFTFGIGAYGVAGMGVNFPANLYGNVTFSKYTFMKFAPAVSYEINEMFSIGFALNMDYATMDFNAGFPPTSPTFPQLAHQGGAAFGWGATIGVLAKINNFIHAGVAYETKQMFPDYTFNTGAGVDKTKFNQPQNVSVGFAVFPIETLKAGFDFTWINWPQTNGANQPTYTTNNSGAIPWNLSWKNQYVVKFGIEWQAIEKLALRTGFNYAKNPLNSTRAFEGIAFPAIQESHITLGAGYQISEKVAVNVGYIFAPVVEQNLSNPTEQFISNAWVRMWQQSFEMGIAYNF